MQDIARNLRNCLPCRFNLFLEETYLKPCKLREHTFITLDIASIVDIIIKAYHKPDSLKNLLLHLIILIQHLYLEYIISLRGMWVFQEYYQYIVPRFNDQIHISTRLKVFYWNKKHLFKVELISFFHQVNLYFI